MRALMYRTTVRCRSCREKFVWQGRHDGVTYVCRHCGATMAIKVRRVLGKGEAVAALKAMWRQIAEPEKNRKEVEHGEDT